jgi:hypothetical protein
VRGVLGVEVHWHLFCYFFKFVCLKERTSGDNRVCPASGEAGAYRRLHPHLAD